MSEGEVFGVREKIFYQEREVKNESNSALRLYKKIVARWIELSVEICQALNVDKNESVEVLSRIY